MERTPPRGRRTEEGAGWLPAWPWVTLQVLAQCAQKHRIPGAAAEGSLPKSGWPGGHTGLLLSKTTRDGFFEVCLTLPRSPPTCRGWGRLESPPGKQCNLLQFVSPEHHRLGSCLQSGLSLGPSGHGGRAAQYQLSGKAQGLESSSWAPLSSERRRRERRLRIGEAAGPCLAQGCRRH